MRRLIQFALLVLLCIATATLASAQGLDGTLRVTVTDASGASVESATVKVINEATNLSVSSNTSSAGTYVFPNLKIGTYSISVEKDGFKKSIQKGVTVASNQVAEAKVLLEIGSVSAVVEVEAGSDLIKTTTSELSTTIDGRITNTLPVNTLGGDVAEFSAREARLAARGRGSTDSRSMGSTTTKLISTAQRSRLFKNPSRNSRC